MEVISAGDLEKYCYCPLSWSLSKQSQVTSSVMQKGHRRHDELAANLQNIVSSEDQARRYERIVVWASVLATALALVGVFLFSFPLPTDRGRVLGVLTVLWVFLAALLLYRSARSKDVRLARKYETDISLFAILAMVTALNSVPIFGITEEQAVICEIAALLLLMGACIALFKSQSAGHSALSLREKSGVNGDIRYVGEGLRPSNLLTSEKYGLSGRPDYILEKNGQLVPVEIKTGRTPQGPLFSHILQVAAYCMLLDEDRGRVSYGLLRYDEEEHEIEYNDELKRLLLSKLDEMRRASASGDIHRNHRREGKCRSCSRRELCPERLV